MFIVAPFGFTNMTGHMQRQMERLLGELNKFPFLDDTPIASKSTQEHIQDVLKVLEKLTYGANLRVKIRKCQFFKSSARILGYIIGRDGLRMDPQKVKAIVQWTKPIDGKGMQRFLGAANYHRDFSHEFATIAAPLESLRNIKGLIIWTSNLEEAFN